MERLPDDICRYIRLTESTSMSVEDEIMLEDIQVPDLGPPQYLLEDINDMVFKFRSYSELDESQDYARGVEEGLALAANMLERLLERYSEISKE